MQKQIDLLFYLPELGGGGAEMNAVRVSNQLAEYGIRVSFAVCRGGGSYESLLNADISVYVLDTGSIPSSTLQIIRSVPPLRRLINTLKPDILCPVMDHVSCAAIVAVRGCSHQPKVVLSIQNSLKAKLLEKNGLRQKIQRRLVQKLFPEVDHILSISRGVADDIRLLVPAVRDRISIVHNAGFDATANEGTEASGAMEEIHRPDSGMLLLACGRLVEQKGYRDLFKAVAEVLQSREIHLWILGDGPLRDELSAFAIKLGINDNIRFLGFRPDPQQYMKVADIFVLSSLWEGFGNVIVEAMSVELPVIATDCPHGPSEIITSEKNGLLVERANYLQLASAINRLMEDTNLRERIAIAGKQRSADFSPKKIAEGYATVYQRTMIG